MKRILSYFLFVSITLIIQAQVETKYYASPQLLLKFSQAKELHKNRVVHKMPIFDVAEMLQEDSLLAGMDTPYRFGKDFLLSVSLDEGVWHQLDNGRVWTITFESKGALSLNFIFDNFYLPEGATLEIINEEGTAFYGPVRPDAIPKDGHFMTDLIPGEKATIYLYEPFEKIGNSTLTISRVIHAYRGFDLNLFNNRNQGDSNDCNIDVACYPKYAEEAKGVGLIVLPNGNSLCSGSLLMSTDMSFKPYFLTAFHCVDSSKNGNLSDTEKEAVEDWMFKFNFKRTTCEGTTISTGTTYNGAIFRAAWNNTDFALVEINQDLRYDTNLSWLGWDRSGNTPSNGAGIHHPQGDIMKISIDEDDFTTVKWSGINSTNEYNHWGVNFDYGIYEDCSSGSPLLNQNKRVVGQLHGGPTPNNICNKKEAKYGKFDISWTGGGTDDTRLSNWLDSISTNQTAINLSSPLLYMSISGPTVPEAQSTYSVSHLLDNCSVAWNYSGTTIAATDTSTTFNGQFAITNQRKQYICGTLTASIYYQGSVIGTITKPISSGANFSGTYSQEGGQVVVPFGSPIYHDPIPTTPFADQSYVRVHTVQTFTLTSSMFSSSTLTSEDGSFPTGWNQNGNTITYNYPRLGGPSIPVIGRSNTGYDVYKFTVKVIPDLIDPGLPILSPGNGTLTISLGNEQSEDGNSRSTETDLDELAWDVEIVNVLTGDIAYKGSFKGRSQTISTNGWTSGFYVVRIDINGESISRKIYIK